MTSDLCVVCRHRPPAGGYVCDTDRRQLATQIAGLRPRLEALHLQLVPAGGGGLGERVTAARVEAPVGARVDALTLVGPGSDGLSAAAVAGMFHPRVRKWRTVELVTVERHTAAGPVLEDVEIPVWHQEPLVDTDGQVLLVADDDQVGILPPAEWLDSWTRSWRRSFGHHTRQPVPRRPADARPVAGPAARAYTVDMLLGLSPGHGGAPVLRTDDPLAQEWEIRFGLPELPAQVRADIDYLAAWLDTACDEDAGIAAFAVELRAVDAELARVLGEVPAQQWLGRCPTAVTDRATDTTRACGVGLWQDPHAPQVVCHRCRSEWGPGKMALIHLAKSIRRVWPIDRRRRYTADEIDAMAATRRPMRCPTCALPVGVRWQEATGRGDPCRTWRPAAIVCDAGCPAAGRLI